MYSPRKIRADPNHTASKLKERSQHFNTLLPVFLKDSAVDMHDSVFGMTSRWIWLGVLNDNPEDMILCLKWQRRGYDSVFEMTTQRIWFCVWNDNADNIILRLKWQCRRYDSAFGMTTKRMNLRCNQQLVHNIQYYKLWQPLTACTINYDSHWQLRTLKRTIFKTLTLLGQVQRRVLQI